MLAEVFETELEQFYNSDLTRPILTNKLNLHQLYESFVEKKFSIYFDDKNQTDTSKTSAKRDQSILKAHYLIMHQHYALLSLISKKDLEKLLSKEYIKDVQIQKNGIIDGVINGKPIFVHKTFAEYFASNYFVDNLNQKEVQEFLINFGLVNPEFEVLRSFINSNLEQSNLSDCSTFGTT